MTSTSTSPEAITTPAAPALSRAEWQAVARLYAEIEPATSVSPFARIVGRLAQALTGRATPAPVDTATATLREFVCRTRRFGRPATDLAPALQASGFSAGQVAALAMLSIH